MQLYVCYNLLGITPTTRLPKTLRLPRRYLGYLLAARSGHGDYAAYHDTRGHVDAERLCRCGQLTTPDHFNMCSRTRPPSADNRKGWRAIRWLLVTPRGCKIFVRWARRTRFFEKVRQPSPSPTDRPP